MDESSQVQQDAGLALRMMEGDEDALRELIRVHGPRVKGNLHASYSPDVADEAWTDAVRKVWENAIGYEESKAPLGNWFLAIARNCAISIHRGRQRRDNAEELADDYPYRPPLTEDEEDVPDKKERARRRKRKAAVREILDSMTERQRIVMEADLAYLSGDAPHDAVAPAEDLASQLNTTKNNIYKIRHDARAKLRKEMERRSFYKEGQS